ncbi:MAG: SAP domain-containing protein [Clostridia bacterium]|nr:SAP domain-containing protein [Clostridia bacterium]
MDFIKFVEQIPNITIAKRVASAYVADYRRLELDEIKEFLKKTAKQYTAFENVSNRLDEIKLDSNRAVRIIAPILLRDYLLNQDDFISPTKDTDSAVLNYEKSIVDESNNFDESKISKDFALFKHMLDAAWAYNDDISVDEKNLLETLRKYLSISTKEFHMLEAKSGRFPTPENVLHTYDDIEDTRKVLQAKGLTVAIKNSDGVICDMIPDDIAQCIRRYYNIEIRAYGYEKLVDYVIKKTKKQYLIDIVNKASQYLSKAKIEISNNPTVNELKDIILKSIQPSNLIGGFSPRDGLDVTMLSAWCGDIGLNVSGNKVALIDRILEYYDSMRRIEIKTEDEREKLIAFYNQLANRDLKNLRANNIIEKDLQCEHLFEDATNYLFEKMLLNKPLTLTGSEHPDGKLSFKDKYIMWDNKSKETAVNLKDHIQQFERYIKTSDKDVTVFMVIAPKFTPQSVQECVDFSLNNDTQILLITAEELKTVAETWLKKHPGEIFNLGYFKQNGRFDIRLLNL